MEDDGLVGLCACIAHEHRGDMDSVTVSGAVENRKTRPRFLVEQPEMHFERPPSASAGMLDLDGGAQRSGAPACRGRVAELAVADESAARIAATGWRREVNEEELISFERSLGREMSFNGERAVFTELPGGFDVLKYDPLGEAHLGSGGGGEDEDQEREQPREPRFHKPHRARRSVISSRWRLGASARRRR